MADYAQPVPFRTQLGMVQVTHEQVLTAMKIFDVQFRLGEGDSGTLYAIEESGMRYPPKRILELATGVPRSQFYGGKPTNDVFVGLGFQIVESDNNHTTKSPQQVALEQARLDLPVPNVDDLTEELFTKTWIPLDDSALMPDSQYPGVYVLAYPDHKWMGHPVEEKLAGARIREDDIFYVGVSHAGVRKRLRQFLAGVEDGGHHSGAMRFYEKVAGNTPYSNWERRKPFFVASISVPCTYLKTARSPMDIRKLGVVAQLEWHVLARVKERSTLKQEPWLNKK